MSTPSPHACASCGRRCRACEDGAPCTRATWCTWCTEVYRDNAPDPETGRVHCAECDGYLPKLAVLIERKLPRYPRHCGSCRPAVEQREAEEAAARRAEEAAFREYQNTAGADSVVAGNGDSPKRTRKGRTPKLPAGPPPAYREEQEQRAMSRAEQVAAASREQAARDPDAHAVRGGFVPRPAPGQREFPDHGEFAYGKTEWPGTRMGDLYSGS
ncbi:hypothetical protein [Pseudonocardia sp.]|uniref:hypothetical protein n=1 Tax=Pseudonocardia sp. TaxID=60912 RepID=UPI0026321C09|nr:hypothetical protein [Pseudonocardia sp.]